MLLRSAQRVCVLTGAGVSAESGVPTFRASDGLWEGHRVEEVAHPDGFRDNPQLVWNFYHARRANLATVKPNPGHYALAAIEARFGDRFTLTTQNIDGLHQAAGSKNVLEVHGSIHRTRCTVCRKVETHPLEPLAALPMCECGGLTRVDVVWFSEMLPTEIWDRAKKAAEECDVFMVVGTSAVVHPAASLIPLAVEWSEPAAKVIEVNVKGSDASRYADIGLYGPSGEILPRLVTLMDAG